MTSPNLRYEIMSKLASRSFKSIGKIEVVSMQNTRVFAIIRRTDSSDGEMNLKLYNDLYSTPEEELSIYELGVPLLNINLSQGYNPLELIGKYAIVTEVDGVAINAEFIGDRDDSRDEMIDIDRNFFFNARMRVLERGEALTSENIQAELQEMGLDQETTLALFRINLTDVYNNALIWAGDSYFHKETRDAQLKEFVVEAPEFLRYLNKNPLKIKACHKFNKLFTGR